MNIYAKIRFIDKYENIRFESIYILGAYGYKQEVEWTRCEKIPFKMLIYCIDKFDFSSNWPPYTIPFKEEHLKRIHMVDEHGHFC